MTNENTHTSSCGKHIIDSESLHVAFRQSDPILIDGALMEIHKYTSWQGDTYVLQTPFPRNEEQWRGYNERKREDIIMFKTIN